MRYSLEDDHRFEVVGEAADGKEAIDLVARLRPRLVLLDLSMPRMDGLEALPHILEASPETIVLILSGFSEDRLGPAAARFGAVGYLQKGLAPHELVQRIVQLMEQKPTSGPRAAASPRATRLQ